MDPLPKQEVVCRRCCVFLERLGGHLLPHGAISVVTSSPFPHSCNLIATTKASLGGSHPMPTILGQPGSLWDWSVRESTVTPQMPCLSSREPSRQGNAKAWEEHSGGVADSTAKPWGTGTSPITASIPETQGQGQLLLRNLMSIRMGLKWTEPLPTRTREGWLGVLHFLPPQLGGSSKHTCLNRFQWTLAIPTSLIWAEILPVLPSPIPPSLAQHPWLQLR